MPVAPWGFSEADIARNDPTKCLLMKVVAENYWMLPFHALTILCNSWEPETRREM